MLKQRSISAGHFFIIKNKIVTSETLRNEIVEITEKIKKKKYLFMYLII